MSTRLEPLNANSTTAGITEQAAREALWFFNGSSADRAAQEPGGFNAAIWRAISIADNSNLNRLASGFGAMVAAYKLATRNPEGIAILHGVIAVHAANAAGEAWAPAAGDDE